MIKIIPEIMLVRENTTSQEHIHTKRLIRYEETREANKDVLPRIFRLPASDNNVGCRMRVLLLALLPTSQAAFVAFLLYTCVI